MKENWKELLKEVRACKYCEKNLPLGARPVLDFHPSSKILIVGQAPGVRVHETGIPWNDPSGDRLREWLDIDHEIFYNSQYFSIVPMGFCYPGKGSSGDLPPRKECSELWHERILKVLPELELVLLIGQYAQSYFLEGRRKKNLTKTVKAWKEYGPRLFPLPHPSPRNFGWRKKNPWFEEEVIPELRLRVHSILEDHVATRL